MKAYTEDEVRQMLKRLIARAGTQDALARRWRTKRSRFNNFVAGNEPPGPTLLKRMGLTRVVLYVG